MELCQSLNLDNGTKLLFIPNSHHPVVSLQAWIRFGAGDEDESIAGIAHLFEHLLFKGTEKRAVGQIAREIESLGGDLNAFTSYDHTVMHLTLASEHTKQGFEVLSDAIINSVVNEDELSREKPVILEEIKRRNDRPGSKAGDLVRKLLFGDHPYHRPVIGYADVVNNTPREKIMEVYKRYYNRNNVFLVCCGDVSSEKALEYANQYFDKLPDGEKVATRNDSKKNNTFTQKFIHNDSPDSIMYLSCQGPSGSELDSAALDAWTLIMGQGESSRLHNRLVLEEGRVRSLGAWCWAPRNKGSIDFAFRKSGGIANETEWIIDRFCNEINRDLRRD